MIRKLLAGALLAILLSGAALAADQTPAKLVQAPNGPVHPANFQTGDTVGAPHGGTGLVSPTAHCVIIGEGASPAHVVCPVSSTDVLTDNGPGNDPSFQAAAGGGPCTSTALSVQYDNAGAFGCVSGVTSNGAAITFATNNLILGGATSGTLKLNCAATCGTNTLTFPAGTTDFSATGGAHKFVAQASAGAALTVVQPAFTDLSGNIATSQMNSGTSASSSTFWRGDGSWATPAGGTGGGLFSGQLSTVPTQSSTGLTNTAGSFSTAPSDTAAGIFFTSTTAGALYTTSVPATPYSITILLSWPGSLTIVQMPRFGWTDTTKYQGFLLAEGSPTAGGTPSQQFVQSLSGINTFSANVYGPQFWSSAFEWLKIRDDGTNVYFMISGDGVNFATVYQVAKSSGYLGSSGYSHIFISTAGNGMGTVMSWTQGS